MQAWLSLKIVATLALIGLLVGEAAAQSTQVASALGTNIINAGSISKFSPRTRADILNAIGAGLAQADAAGINTPLRIQHFFSEIATETDGLTTLSEDMNYTTSELLRTWPHKFSSASQAEQLAAEGQIAIADYVYAGVLGNGGQSSGDGWTYRGGGLIQLTGRMNYKNTGEELGLDGQLEQHPELLRMGPTAFDTAVAFWKSKNINALADQDDVTGVRKAVNGGTNGLGTAKIWLALAKKVFVVPVAGAPAAMPAAEAPGVFNQETLERALSNPQVLSDPDVQSAVSDKLDEINKLESPQTAQARPEAAKPGTQNAESLSSKLREFQQSHGLASTGQLDYGTLYEMSKKKYWSSQQ